MSTNMPHTILMLEYDPDDRFLTTSVFQEQQLKVHIEFVNNSDEFFAWLDHRREQKLSYPDLVLVTLRAAPLDGKEILKQLKSNPEYQHIPVVLLAGITDQRIIKECYAAGASSFIQKPSLNKDTNDKIINFFRYWFETVELV